VIYRRRSLPIDRFHSLIHKSVSGCWIWTAAKDKDGYGLFSLTRNYVMRATRYSYLMFNGPILGGEIVCHTCDTPQCVNPAHLFTGSHKDNMRDMTQKGRLGLRHGELARTSRLTQSEAVEIISRLKDGECQSRIAADYAVGRSCIGEISRGRTWKHLQRNCA
jgi:hypothetical protein